MQEDRQMDMFSMDGAETEGISEMSVYGYSFGMRHRKMWNISLDWDRQS